MFTEPTLYNYSDLLRNCDSSDNICFRSIDYVRNVIPADLWAHTPEDLANPNSPINQYLTNLEKNNNLADQYSIIVFIHFQVAASTYNSALLFNLDLDLDHSKKILKEVFFSSLAKSLPETS